MHTYNKTKQNQKTAKPKNNKERNSRSTDEYVVNKQEIRPVHRKIDAHYMCTRGGCGGGGEGAPFPSPPLSLGTYAPKEGLKK